MLTINDLKFSNQKFWTSFFATSFPTSLDEETDMSLSEMIDENCSTDIEWWKNFTKYYDGVLDETDGYIDNPEIVVCNLTATQTLKIEFHPGDTVYYVNDKQIACTGGHYSIQIFPFTNLLKYAEEINDNRIFFLLLPLTIIKRQDADNATQIISNYLKDIFEVHLCNLLANSIVYGLTEE
ncbi:MAG: Imm19 family immunity protein [Bacteroidales bacterium]|nr:Imm19 family immunity protein [Lachnoclostridium sp.]MCM1385656.1 Imm19 family immunity protein [Lachnoclostridium sp.]MCM1466329.1 Imm19 family immunity protein [Bacteroidales bacterium]